MIKLKDHICAVAITMIEFDEAGYIQQSNFENDFYEAGSLPWDEETNTYTVPDVEYCIAMALDWKYRTGDFYEEKKEKEIDRRVWIE